MTAKRVVNDQDLVDYNNSGNLSRQMRVLTESVPTAQGAEDQKNTIRGISDQAYRALYRATSSPSAEEIADVHAETNAMVSRLLEENDLPVERVMLEEIQQGTFFTLAQDFFVNFGVSDTGAINGINIPAGETIGFPNDPVTEVKIKYHEMKLVMQRRYFPDSGLLVQKPWRSS